MSRFMLGSHYTSLIGGPVEGPRDVASSDVYFYPHELELLE